MKQKFKLTSEQLAGLADLTIMYLEEIEWKEIRGRWMEQTLYELVDKLDAARRKIKMELKQDCKFSFSINHAFAFELLYDKHPIEPTNYIDNTILFILQTLKKHYT